MVAILIGKLVSLFFMMFCGVVLMKCRLLKIEDTKAFSRISLYLFMPFIILSAFEVKLTEEVKSGLLLCAVMAALIHLLFICCGALFQKLGKSSAIEQASIIYTNCGNIIIPIVSSVLGPEYVIYTSAYITVYSICVWTHGMSLFENTEVTADGHVVPKKNKPPFGERVKVIVKNPNIIAILFGAVILIFGIQLPGPIDSAVSDIGNMVAPCGMIVIGMVLGSMPMEKIFENSRIYIVTALRMLVLPAITLLLIKLFRVASFLPDGHNILLVTFLSAIAPTAATVNQIAILFDRDAEYSSYISILTTLVALATMPFFGYLYEMM